MTREHLKMWLEAHDCEMTVFEPINGTRPCVKFINKTNGRYTYFELPIDDREMPDSVVRRICDNVVVVYPDCVVVANPEPQSRKK